MGGTIAKRQQFQQPTQQAYYSLEILNQSNSLSNFVTFQQPPGPRPLNVESLAWFVAPIAPRSIVTITWNTNYQFVYAKTGILKPGRIFNASGMKECDPTGKNTTHFAVVNGIPELSDPVAGSASGTLAITEGSDFPLNIYSVGVGMAQNAIFAVNAGPNFKHLFDISTPSYWIAAMMDVKQGVVLDTETISQMAKLNFTPNVKSLRATYESDNTWTVVPN